MAEQPKEVLFGTLGGNDDVGAPMEVSSLCMACGADGTTRILLTRIPHFREVILMAFECPSCGARNNEVQSGAPVNEKGFKASLSVKNLTDLSRQVVKAETASVTLDELELEIPAATQRGVLSTVEGLVNGAIDGLAQEQEYRRVGLISPFPRTQSHIVRHRLITQNSLKKLKEFWPHSAHT
jgi:zinc finger protein